MRLRSSDASPYRSSPPPGRLGDGVWVEEQGVGGHRFDNRAVAGLGQHFRERLDPIGECSVALVARRECLDEPGRSCRPVQLDRSAFAGYRSPPEVIVLAVR